MKTESSLSQIRMIATGALVISVVLMALCRLFENVWPWLAWPRTFYEGATIGGVSGWFVVVALFRQPMGIPIPHTEILPNNMGRLCEWFARMSSDENMGLAEKRHVHEIITTIKAIDARQMAEELETMIGCDLQFIRLNGTIIGGLIGIVIYGCGLFLGKYR